MMTLLEATKMVVPKMELMTAATATGTLAKIAADAIVGTLLQDTVRALQARLPPGVILEATAVDAAVKAGIETGTTHADTGTVITIVDDEAAPAPAQDPLAGVIVPEMTEIAETVATAPTAGTKVAQEIDLPADDLVHRS